MSAAADPATHAVANLIAWAEAELQPVTDTPRLEAELLLAEAAGIGRTAVIAGPDRLIDAAKLGRLEQSVTRRRLGEPLAYIVGHKEFYSLDLAVGPAVLVPRPETETLVEAVLDRLRGGSAGVLDLGTGAGGIAIALKHLRPDLTVTGVDCDAAALDLARANAAAHGVEIQWRLSDWYSAVAGMRFDIIVSNPPYVPSLDPRFEHALSHEPRVALDGGPDGLDAHRIVVCGAPVHLAAGGSLIVEHGFDQREALQRLASATSLVVDALIDDLAGLPRVACFKAGAS